MLFLYAFLSVFSIGLLILLVAFGSAIIINFAPLGLAALMGLSFGWGAFFLTLIIAYALYSYKGLRTSIVAVSLCMAGCMIISVVSLILLQDHIDNQMTLCFVRLLIGIVCTILGIVVDIRKDDATGLPISNYIKIPMVIQQILASFIYSFGALFLFSYSFEKVIKGGFFASTAFQWIFLIVFAVIAFFLQLVFSNTQEAA